MRKKVLIYSLLVTFALIVTLISFNLMREPLLLPIIHAWNHIRLVLFILWRRQDQYFIWFLFIYIGLLLTIRTLISLYHREEDQRPKTETHSGPLQEWSNRLASLDEGMYYRWRFAQRVRKMVERMLASQTGKALDDVQRSIQDGEVDLNPRFLAYLQSTYDPEIKKYFSTYRGEVETDPIRNLQAEQILEYLESFIKNSGGTPWT